jgi:hypothetical protein
MTSVAFARSVMRALAELRGPEATAPLSPRDWALLFDWERRGVPLATILEALREGPPARRGRRTRLRGPLRLSDVAPSVEEAWEVLRSGEAAPAPSAPPAARNPLDAWRDALGTVDRASPLAAVLSDLLGRAASGAEPRELDRELDERIEALASEGDRDAIASEVTGELAPFRELLAADVLAATRTLAIRDRLRRKLGLPRIS